MGESSAVCGDFRARRRPRACLFDRGRAEEGGWGLVVRARLKNNGEKALRLRGFRWVSDISSAYPPPVIQFPKALEPFYFATENFRGDYFGTTTTRGEHYFRPLPHEMVTIGFTEDVYFPGVFIGSGVKPLGLFCAAGSHDVFETMFRLYGGDGEKTWNFEIEHVPQGLEWVEVAPGEIIASEAVYFEIVATSDPQQACDGYYRQLRRQGLFERRKSNPLQRQRIWGSWNFGPMQHVTQEYVLRQLPVLKERFPSVKFVQIDDGYERPYPSGQRAQIDLLYGKGGSYDPVKFPGGPRELVRQIKAHGLRPATWLGFWAAGTSPMMQEHPDWVLRDDMGRPLVYRSHFAAVTGGPYDLCVLDLSMPGVQAYLERLCATVFGEWGFEGVKLDFYSFAFQIRRARFGRGGRTAAQYLKWLEDLFRRHLPEDGFLGWCSAVGVGSPFQGQADYFRYAEDIGSGSWELAKRIALWTLNTNMLLREHPIVPNIDAIGWAPDFTMDQWLSFLALCAISGGTVEIGGDLGQLDDEKVLRMNQCLEMCDLSSRVRCLDVPGGKIGLPPAVWVSEKAGKVRMAAIINWADRARMIGTAALDQCCSDWRSMTKVWPSAARVRAKGVELPAYGSLLVRR